MNRRTIIRICFVIVIFLWLTVLAMPKRFSVVRELAENYYDRTMNKQEYLIRKEQHILVEDKSASEEKKLDSLESLAKNFWATFRAEDAKQVLEGVRTRREKLDPHYNQKTIHTLLVLAEVYRDINQLIPSAECYEQIWKLDKENLPADDSRLMRDQANLALIDYVRGDSDKDESVRKQFFKSSIDHIEQAMQIWHKQKDPDIAALVNLFYLKYLNNREMGNESASRQAYGEMKYLNKLLKRSYTPPWT